MLLAVGQSVSAVVNRPAFSGRLIETAASERLVRVASRLPAAADAFGFECRLAASRAQVDLGLMVSEEGAEVLAAFELECAAPADAAEAWSRLAAFARAWSDPESALARHVPLLFLEFDTDGPPDAVPVPGVFFRIEGVAPRSGVPAWISDEAIGPLRGAPLGRAEAQMLSACFDALPPGGCVLHVATLLSRSSPGVRLFVTLPPDGVTAYLEALAWNERIDAVEDLMAGYGSAAELGRLQFDVGETVSPRMGVEFSPRSPKDWDDLLEWLVRDGLCCDAKRNALLNWPCVYQERLTERSWPCTFVQELSHVKLVYERDRPLEAKAYVTVTPRFSLFK